MPERFSNSASFQYYQLLPSLEDFSTHITEKLCASKDPQCLARARLADSADYLDVDYDSVSQKLVLGTYRHQSPKADGRWNEGLERIGDAKLEIGVLAPEVATEPEQLKLGGFLAVVGEDDRPSKLCSAIACSMFDIDGRAYAVLFPISTPSLIAR